MNRYPLHSLFLSAFWCLGSATAAVTLSIDPPVLTNDFQGKLVLTISGLASNQSVVIGKRADFNGNGVVDDGDLLLQGFRVTDGRQPIIGGIRNLNVPGDEDGLANGQIRVELRIPSLEPAMDLPAGRFVYRVADTNGVGLASQPLEVRPKVLAQGLTGRLTTAGTGAPLTNASLTLLNGNGNGAAVSVLADSNGRYTVYVPPGNYLLLPFQRGMVGSFAAASITVVTNQFGTNDVAMVPGPLSVTGRTVAPDDSGLPGILLFAESGNAYAMAYSDNTGAFDLRVTPGLWSFDIPGFTLPILGCLNPDLEIETNITANVPNVNLVFPRATALIYGTVRDDQSNLMSQLAMQANGSQFFDGQGITYPTGGDYTYTIGVTAGDWWIRPDEDMLAMRDYLSQGTNITGLASGQAARADFVVRRATSRLRGWVRDALGAPVSDIWISANQRDSGGIYIGNSTDANGFYDLGVNAGNWQLNLSWDDLQERGLIAPQVEVSLADGEIRTNTLLVLHSDACITGTVRDNTGGALPGVLVIGNFNLNGTNYYPSARTDQNGGYSFLVRSGPWQVWVNPDDLRNQGYAEVEGQSVQVATGTCPTVNFTVFPIGPLQILTTELPDATLGTFYQAQLHAEGGCGSYHWSYCNGSLPLPEDLAIAEGGMIGGNVLGNQASTNTIWVQVNDDCGHSACAELTLVVRPAVSGPLTVATTSLPGGELGQPYQAQLQGTGGRPPYSWAVAPYSAPLPDPLHLASDGTISGTPSGIGTTCFWVQLTDADFNTAEDAVFCLTNTLPVQIAAATLPNAMVGVDYYAQLQASGGWPPFTWAVVSNTLPGGLYLDGLWGSISGKPTNAGIFTFTVRVTDTSSVEAERSFTITSAGNPVVSTTNLPNATTGILYRQQLQATNGLSPYTWQLAPGSASLPPNLTLSLDGLLSGVPAGAGTNSFMVRVTDSNARSANKVLTLRVVNAAQPRISSYRVLANRHFELKLQGLAGGIYTFQASAAFNQWTNLATLPAEADGTATFVDTNDPGFKLRFYRAVVVTPPPL